MLRQERRARETTGLPAILRNPQKADQIQSPGWVSYWLSVLVLLGTETGFGIRFFAVGGFGRESSAW